MDLLEINVVASIVKNMCEAAAQVYGAGTVAIQLQKVTLKYGRASAWVMHLLQLTLQITCVFSNTPDLNELISIKYIGKLQFEAVNFWHGQSKEPKKNLL